MGDDQAGRGVAGPGRELTKALQCRSLSVTRRIELKLLAGNYLLRFWRLKKETWRFRELSAEKQKAHAMMNRVGFLFWSGREDLTPGAPYESMT